jgi:hypothetical protein
MEPVIKDVVSDAVAVLNRAATGEEIPITQLRNAVVDLTRNQWQEHLNPDEQNQVRGNLETLIGRISPKASKQSKSAELVAAKTLPPQPSEKDKPLIQEFKKDALILINQMKLSERGDVPTEVRKHQAFHQNAILKGTKTIEDRIQKGEKKLNLRKFVRDYCKYVFLNRDPKFNTNKFMIRGSSTLVNGTYDGKDCEFFVITSQKKDKKDVDHHAYAKVVDPSTKTTFWCTAEADKNGNIKLADKHYDTFIKLLGAKYKNYKAVPVMSEKVQDGYFVSYGNEAALEGDEAQEKWANDPILKLLEDPVMLDRLDNPHITPEGHTFSKSGLENVESNPLTRTPIDRNKLTPNLLAAHIMDARMNQLQGVVKSSTNSLKDWHEDPILMLFEDPLTNNLMENLVVAPDGVTYDRKTLSEHLSKSNDIMPDGVTRCRPDQLIPNVLCQSILDLRKEQLGN